MNDTLQVQVGPRDRNGQRVVVATHNGAEHRDQFNTDVAFSRAKFREAALAKFGLDSHDAADSHAWLDSEILRRADAEDDLQESTTEARYSAVTVRLSDVVARPVHWLWPGRIAIGKLTILAGDPGLGKSFLTLAIAATVSRGGAWPDDRSISTKAGGVVLLSAEDGLDDTIRPRLDAAGADVSRIVAMTAIQRSDDPGSAPLPIDLSRDLSRLAEAIEATPGCRLVTIDPVSAYLGGTDSHRNAEVRGLLSQLSDLAERFGVAVVAVTHLRKGEGRAMYRAMGSLAFVAAARTAWLVTEDQEDRSRRLLLPMKNNLAPDVGGLAYRILDRGNGAALEWDPEPVNVSADEALDREAGADRSAREEATEFLRESLADGPIGSKELQADARGAGIALNTLRRAYKDIGGKPRKCGLKGGWLWEWPSEDAHANAEDTQGAQGSNVGIFEQNGYLRDGEANGDTGEAAGEDIPF